MGIELSQLPEPPRGKTGWPWTVPDRPEAGCDFANGPRLTVVTPSLNQAAFLEEAIRSVLLQGYPDLEYIVIDGGSDDGSVEIIRRYEEWLTYWVSGSDDGQSDAIRRGIDRSTGTVLSWLNSDDRLGPSTLQSAGAAFQRQPGAGLVYGRAEICYASGETAGETVGRRFDLADMIKGDNCVAQPSAFFSRSAYEVVGGLDRSLHYAMDLDLWLRIGSQHDTVFVDEVWSDFRQHADSKTSGGRLEFDREIVRITEDAFKSLPLPEGLTDQRSRIQAETLMRLAYRHYQRAEDRECRDCAMRALRSAPSLVRDAAMRRALLRYAFGRRRVSRLKKGYRE